MRITVGPLTLESLVAVIWWQWRQECVAWWEGSLLDICCFCLGGFIAVVARGNPGVNGLSPGLSQHFQYYTILSHSSLSSGVSISFLCVLLFSVTNAMFPLLLFRITQHYHLFSTGIEHVREGVSNSALVAKFPGEGGGTFFPNACRKHQGAKLTRLCSQVKTLEANCMQRAFKGTIGIISI